MTDKWVRVEAPFTPEQVMALNRYQLHGIFHPFTCPRVEHDETIKLIAGEEGWSCASQTCDYTQDWTWSASLRAGVCREVPATLEVSGLEFPALPGGAQPLDGILLTRVMRPDGQLSWVFRFTGDCPPFEALGALETLCNLQQDRLLSLFTEDDPYYEDPG